MPIMAQFFAESSRNTLTDTRRQAHHAPVNEKNSSQKYPRLSFRIPEELRKRLDRIESATVLSRSQVIVWCLREYLGTIEKQHGIKG